MNRERGSVTALILISIAVIMVLVIAYADAYRSVRRSRAHVNFLNAVAQIQLNIRNTVNDPGSWTTTANDATNNPTMACLSSRTCALPQPPQDFVLWPAGVPSYGTLTLATYDGTNPAAGFDLDGKSCTGFSGSGSATCPIHVILKWSTPGCTPTPCDAPVTVQADVQYRPSGLAAFGTINEALLTLTFDQKLTGVSSSCTGQPPPAEVSTCASPPYSHDQLICTSTGWRCGTVYY